MGSSVEHRRKLAVDPDLGERSPLDNWTRSHVYETRLRERDDVAEQQDHAADRRDHPQISVIALRSTVTGRRNDWSYGNRGS